MAHRLDMVIGTIDRNVLEVFLRGTWDDPDPVEGIQLRPVYRWHIRIVLRDGERVYLNLLQSETALRYRITAEAVAKLGQESEEDSRMHLRNIDGTEVSDAVNVIDIQRELVSGEMLPNG